MRPTRAEIDLGAIEHNVRTLVALVEPAALMAVVKADAYGHGAVPVARVVVDAGASWLGVALVEEARELRDAGLAVPILLLSEPHPDDMAEAVALGLAVTVYTERGIGALGAAAAGADRVVEVHLKVDTGMRRVGADPADIVGLHRLVTAHPGLRLGALMTHFAVADGLDEAASTYTAGQWAGLTRVLDTLEAEDLDVPLVHTANSGATLGDARHVAERRELRARSGIVRCGIAVYGLPPDASEDGCRFFAGFDLRPAFRLVSEVSFVKTVPAGTKVSYGLHYETPSETVLATVPIGYADGVPRRLAAGGEVLIGGRRRPIAGAVTMDQIMVDCGPGSSVAVGDEVVLLGHQDGAEITAAEWARRLDTITYEVTTRIGPRVPRVHIDGSGSG